MEYIFKDKSEFISPIRIIFLCGSFYTDKDKNDKRNILEELLSKNPDNKIIILEKFFTIENKAEDKKYLKYSDIGLVDLYTIEKLMAHVTDKIFILHESLSTSAEISLFASNKVLRKKIVTLIPDFFCVEKNYMSGFLKLAYWKKDTQYLKDIITYYPKTEPIIFSSDHKVLYNNFKQNKIRPYLENKIQKELTNFSVTNMTLKKRSYNTTNKLGIEYFYDIKLSKAVIKLNPYTLKNYIFALFSIKEFRIFFYKCEKIVDISNLITTWLKKILKRTIKEKEGKNYDIKIVLSQNNLNEVSMFIIYIMSACNFFNLKEENGCFKIKKVKGSVKTFEKYSELIKKIDDISLNKYKIKKENELKSFYISKKHGYRKIVTYQDKNTSLYNFHKISKEILDKRLNHSIFAKAYIKNSSIVLNAKSHMYNDIFISLDIANFFKSINHNLLINILYYEINKNYKIKTFSKKNCRKLIESCSTSQKGIAIGLIPSPILANIYLKEFDGFLYSSLKKLNLKNIIYTRYADDMIISYQSTKNNFKANEKIKIIVSLLLKKYFLKINLNKTKVIDLNKSNHVKITGINLTKNDNNYRNLTIGRKIKRDLYIKALNILEYKSKDKKLEIQKIKGLQSFILSVEGTDYENCYSLEMKNLIKTKGYSCLKDLIDKL